MSTLCHNRVFQTYRNQALPKMSKKATSITLKMDCQELCNFWHEATDILRVIDRSAVEYLYELDDMRVANRKPPLRCPQCSGRVYCYSALRAVNAIKIIVSKCGCKGVKEGAEDILTGRIGIVAGDTVKGYLDQEIIVGTDEGICQKVQINDQRIVVQTDGNGILSYSFDILDSEGIPTSSIIELPKEMKEKQIQSIQLNNQNQIAVLWSNGYFTSNAENKEKFQNRAVDSSVSNWSLVHSLTKSTVLLCGTGNEPRGEGSIVCLFVFDTESGHHSSKQIVGPQSASRMAIRNVVKVGRHRKGGVYLALSKCAYAHLLCVRRNRLSVLKANHCSGISDNFTAFSINKYLPADSSEILLSNGFDIVSVKLKLK